MKMTESQKLECKIKREFFMKIVQTFNSNDKAAIINKLDQIREKKENGDKFSITNVVLTKILSNPDLNKNLFFELIYLTGTKYTCEYTKRYPSGILSNNRINVLNALFSSILSIEEIIYVFFNTRLRNEIALDHLMDYAMQKRGISTENLISLLSEYWFYGKVRYIAEDGFLRIIPYSFGTTRLPSTNSNIFRISQSDGTYRTAEIGDCVYFKFKSYNLSNSMFSIHYLCSDPKIIEQKWLDKSNEKYKASV